MASALPPKPTLGGSRSSYRAARHEHRRQRREHAYEQPVWYRSGPSKLVPERLRGRREEALDVRGIRCDRRRRQRRQEATTVAHRAQSRVEHREHAAVEPMPQQAPEPLLQRENRQRHLVLGERVAAARADRLEPRRGDRIARASANGSLSTITQLSASPMTSTPCQKLDVASSTACGVSRKRVSSSDRGAVPCTRIGYSSASSTTGCTQPQHRVAREQHERAPRGPLQDRRRSRARPRRRTPAASDGACAAAGRGSPVGRSRTPTARRSSRARPTPSRLRT